MSTPKLLKEYIRLVLETEAPVATRAPFTIRGPVKKIKSTHRGSTYTIAREFPVVMPPGMLDAMRVTPDELDANGALDGEHEVGLDVDVYFQKSRFKGSYYQPPDPDEFEIQDWTVEEIDGFMLSPEDAKALKDYLGELTDDELEGIQETFFDRGYDEPEPPEPDDYYDDRDY